MVFAVAGVGVSGYFLMKRAETLALLICCGCGILARAATSPAAPSAPAWKPLWPSPARRRPHARPQPSWDPRNGITPGPIAVLGFAEPSLIFLLGTDTVIADPDDAADAVSEGRPVIVEAKQEPAFRAELAKAGLSVQPVAVVKGVNYSKGKPVALTLYRAAAAAKLPATPQATAPNKDHVRP